LKHPYLQGQADSLCSVYSLVNASRLVNNLTIYESQLIFNETIRFLSKKRKLAETLIGGVKHRDMFQLMCNIVGDNFQWKISGNGFQKISVWWDFANNFLKENHRSAIIVSFGGAQDHLSVIQSMTNKTMVLFDSSQIRKIRKSSCRLQGYPKDDCYVIYPSQSFLCWKTDP
jgi:hypothetical protein